jgi:hypothetical protein
MITTVAIYQTADQNKVFFDNIADIINDCAEDINEVYDVIICGKKH